MAVTRIAPGRYANDTWIIQRVRRMDAQFWFAYRMGSLTKSVWNDLNAIPFVTLAEAKAFVGAN